MPHCVFQKPYCLSVRYDYLVFRFNLMSDRKQTGWSRAYNEKTYERLAITIPKGRKQDIESYLKSREGYETSINGFVNLLIREKLGLSESEWKRKEGEE